MRSPSSGDLTDGGDSVYHEGERRVQERAGVREMASRIGRSIRARVPDRAAAFLTLQRMLVVGTVDEGGRPWASVLTGRPGFARVPDPGTLLIEGIPPDGDPAAGGVRPGSPIGTLAIDLATRRRARVNGVVRSVSAGQITIAVDQAYANCPKYIQRRMDSARDAASSDTTPGGGQAVRTGHVLTADQVGVIQRADTFFIATTAPGAGADASHRGGNPGFVRVRPGELVWPDYVGNSMFNTLGNIEAYPRAGLTFLEFESGSSLQITGAASIDWDRRRAAEFPGAQRLVRLKVERVVASVPRFLPLLELVDYSPFNPPAQP